MAFTRKEVQQASKKLGKQVAPKGSSRNNSKNRVIFTKKQINEAWRKSLNR